MSIPPQASWTLAAQLAQEIRALIRSGTITVGERVPSQNELALDYSVSVDTAKRALAMLAAEGLIVRRRGIGSIVREASLAAEVMVPPGTRITARIPRKDEAAPSEWVPLLVIEQPGEPERIFPADQVIIIAGGLA